MDFRKALAKALNICGERAVDPTLLYYALFNGFENLFGLLFFSMLCAIIDFKHRMNPLQSNLSNRRNYGKRP